MAEQKKTEGDEAAEAKPKGKKKLVIFAVLGVVLLAAGIGVPMFLMGGEKKEATEEEPVEEVKELKVVDLGQFVVNLSETTSFLKVFIKLEYDATILAKAGDHGGEGGGEGHGGGAAGGEEGGEGGGGGMPPHLMKKEPQIKDAVIRVLSSKKSDELLTQDGKERLKEELVEGINEAVGLEEPAVTAVYFTDFIIQ